MIAIIIEDETRSALMLKQMLAAWCPGVQVAGLAEDIEEGYQLIKSAKPDLVFLDIELPSGSGFDLLAKYSTAPFQIIFTTAYNHYALKALKSGALDYLLKPIDKDELCLAVKKAEERLQEGEPNGFFTDLLAEIKKLQQTHKISLPTEHGKLFINQEDIMYCRADGSYTCFYLRSGKTHLVSKNIKEFEGVLSAENFIRIHHAHIVNINFVTEYRKGRGGSVILQDGTELGVAARKKDEFLNLLKKE